MADELDDDLPGPLTSLDPPKKAKPKSAVKAEEEVEEEKPISAPKKNVHSPRCVREAVARGATQAYLDANDSATIWEAIHDHDAKHARVEPKVEKKAEPEEEDFDLGPDAEEFDEKTKKLLKKIALAPRKEAKVLQAKLEAEIAELKQLHTQRRDTDINTMLDDAFDAMPAKFKKILGDGSGTDPAFLKSAEGKRRIRVFQEAGIDLNKATPKSTKRALLDAAETLFGFVESPDEEEDPAPKVKKKVPPKDPESGRFTAEDFANGKIAKGSERKTGLEQLDVKAGVAQILRNGGYMASLEGDMDDLPG